MGHLEPRSGPKHSRDDQQRAAAERGRQLDSLRYHAGGALAHGGVRTGQRRRPGRQDPQAGDFDACGACGIPDSPHLLHGRARRDLALFLHPDLDGVEAGVAGQPETLGVWCAGRKNSGADTLNEAAAADSQQRRCRRQQHVATRHIDALSRIRRPVRSSCQAASRAELPPHSRGTPADLRGERRVGRDDAFSSPAAGAVIYADDGSLLNYD